MESTITEQIIRLEHDLDELKQRVLGLRPPPKSWLGTVGRLPDDELSRSAERLGREWRDQTNRAEA